MKNKLPTESDKNNKYFYPIITNSGYIKMMKRHTLPVLNNTKAYKEMQAYYKKKLIIANNEKRKYQKLLSECQSVNTSLTPAFPVSVGEDTKLVYSSKSQAIPKCRLVIEVVKGWSNTKIKPKQNNLPILEVQKLAETEFGQDKTYVSDSKKAKIIDGVIMWSQVFEITYNEAISDIYKKFRISLFQHDKHHRNLHHIGTSHTINILTTLDSQEVIFKTFDFSNGHDIQWSVLTRIQYVKDPRILYLDILDK